MKKKAISLGVEYIEAEVVGASLTRGSCGSLALQSLRVAPSAMGKESSHTPGAELEIKAEQFVNAAGAWGGKLVDILIAASPHRSTLVPTSSGSTSSSDRTVTRLPVEPRKRCIFTVHCPVAISSATSAEGGLCPPPNTPLVIDPSGVYFRPEGRKFHTPIY